MINIFAPVIIPTLNRYDHFRQCLDSLEQCTGASNTEVYVGLDFPPSDKYKAGWEKIDLYLREKEQRNGFLRLVVFRRDHNCGIGNPSSNSALLSNYISENYDRYIFTEDDNVFSPNFLEYINKGLEKFKDNDEVYAICGYSHPYSFKHGDNTYFYHQTDMSAWGYGVWSMKMKKLNSDIKDFHFFKNSLSLKNVKKIYRFGLNKLYLYLCLSTTYSMKKERITDGIISVYLQLKDYYIVMPTFTKVRNIGWDNAGQSFEKKGIPTKMKDLAIRHQTQDIDFCDSFEYIGEPTYSFDENNQLAAECSDGKISLREFLYSTFIGVCWNFFKRLMIFLKIFKY